MKISGTEYARVLQSKQDAQPLTVDREDLPETTADPTLDDTQDSELIQNIVRSLDELPDTREELIKDLRARIAAGKYKVSAEAIAELMIRRAQADRIR